VRVLGDFEIFGDFSPLGNLSSLLPLTLFLHKRRRRKDINVNITRAMP
jgi:hypothetical protein